MNTFAKYRITASVTGALLLCLLLGSPVALAQVGIDVTSPNPGAVLDLKVPSKDKGLLLPVVGTSDWETNVGKTSTLTEPADGLLVYDSDQQSFYFYNGTTQKWQSVNPFTYRRGSNAVDEDDFVLPIGNGKKVVIGTTGAEEVEVNGRVTTTGTITSTQDVTVTTGEFVGRGTIPLGGIIMWSGDPAAVPTGWTLCDGDIVNGNQTPDLRGRFIVSYDERGAGAPAHSDAGYAAVNVAGGLKEVTLTTNQIPSHNHTAVTTSNGTHNHQMGTRGFETNGAQGADGSGDDPTITTRFDGAHGHDISVGFTGGGLAHENRPPYYVLAFIMRIH